jgi:hypothetical protein
MQKNTFSHLWKQFFACPFSDQKKKKQGSVIEQFFAYLILSPYGF